MQIFITYFLAGALGSLAKDIVEDGKLTLPKCVNGQLLLGCLAGMTIGGFAGYFIDHSIETAFMSGFTGTSLLAAVAQKKMPKVIPEAEQMQTLIRTLAIGAGVNPDLACAVAQCESNFIATAVRINTTGSRDRGLFQINDYWHKEVTDEQAFDPHFATVFFCDAVKAGHISWWDASKPCWSKIAPLTPLL